MEFQDVTTPLDDAGDPSDPLLPLNTAASIDPVEAALAAGVAAIATSMAKASPADLVTLADRMATLARELEARREARGASNVVALDRARGKGER